MLNITEILLQQANTVIKNAYAPYSKFQVAACILTDQGNYYSGCNVENASYGLSQCAEATAIGNMIVNGERRIQEILILGPTDKLCTPCGACRQKIYEFATAETPVHLATTRGIATTAPLRDFLPYPFHL